MIGRMTLTRRQVIRVLGALAAVPVTGCGDNVAVPSSGPFTGPQRRALAAFADVIIPPDDEPGGSALGSVAYIERLLAAFDVNPPAIFADGPFSGRMPFPDGTVPENAFRRFVELDRVSEAAWRLRILGEAPDGTRKPALVEQIAAGIDAAISTHGDGLADLPPATLANVFDAQTDEWRSLVIELVTEAAFAAPEYGGNIELAGWKLCHFEGDSQPLGYSQLVNMVAHERPDAPLSTANPGPDPAPLDAEVIELLKIVTAFLGGRTA